jgi:AcrR family transcriptional regulator
MTELLGECPERAGMPAAMLQAFSGSMRELARTRLHQGREAEMPAAMEELWKMVEVYRPPPRALRAPAGRPRGRESLDGHDVSERTLRALAAVVAERGYAATTVDAVVSRASISKRTFYRYFASKQDALMAALDSGGEQQMAAVMPALRRAPDWPSGVGAGLRALFSFLASRPALARLIAVEVYAAGIEAVEHRGHSLRRLEHALGEGRESAPEVPAIAAEAIVGGVYALAYERINSRGPQELPALAPLCTYIALAPFIGAEEACEVANREGRSGSRDNGPRGDAVQTS